MSDPTTTAATPEALIESLRLDARSEYGRGWNKGMADAVAVLRSEGWLRGDTRGQAVTESTPDTASTERVHTCPRCGEVKWTIIRDCDHLAAECPRCKVAYDIGWSTRGYV